MVVISMWAIILHNMSHVITSSPFLSGGKYELLILLLSQLKLLFINPEGNIQAIHIVAVWLQKVILVGK